MAVRVAVVEAMRQEPIRSYEAWLESFQNFSWLSDNVPGATDFDMVLHARNGRGDNRFLVFEFKAAGKRLPKGQQLLLSALQEEGWVVVVVWGPQRDGTYLLGYDWQGRVTKEELSARVDEWWSQNKKKRAA